MLLYSNSKYEMEGYEIKSVNNPGIAGIMMSCAKFPCGFTKGARMMQCWAADSNDKGWIKRKLYCATKSFQKVVTVL